MTIRRVPSVDSEGKVYESQLPTRLQDAQLKKTIQDTFVEMLASGTQRGVAFAYSSNAKTISASVAISTGGTAGSSDTTPPGQVSSFSATRTSSSSADLIWGTATDDVGVTGYRIWRASILNNTPGTPVVVSNASANVRTWTDAGIDGTTAYQYSIRAFDGAGNQSGTVAVANIATQPATVNAPTAPQSLAVTQGSTAGTATISWQAPASDGGAAVSGYVYSRDGQDANGSGPYTSTLQASATRTATFTNLVAGATYNLAVLARNASGDSSLARVSYTVPTPVSTTPAPTSTTMPRVVTANGVSSLRQGSTSERLRLAGVCMWGMQDYITGEFGANQYASRDLSAATAKSWGANVVRLRFLISDYNKGSKSGYLAQLKAWRDAVLSRDMYLIVTFWDSLDGDYQDAGWATEYSKAFAGMSDVVNALGFDPRIMYEPWNEPNNVSDDQWLKAMQDTLRHYRTTIGYKGVLFVNSNVWSHRYDDTRWSQLEALDASLLGVAQHQLVFCRHDYANEYPNKTWDASKWVSENGSGSTKHAIFESEFGNYNGDASTVSVSWSQNAASFFGTRFSSQSSYVGGAAFLYGPWYDANAMTGSDFKTPNEWGVAVRDRFLGLAAGQPPTSANSTGGSTDTGTTTGNASGILMPSGSVSNSSGIFNLVYSTDFDQVAALGSFPANSAYSARFDAYQNQQDGSGYGNFNASKTTFVQSSKLQMRMFTESGTSYVSAPVVRSTSGNTYSGLTYGRYSTCMRMVREAGSDTAYRVSFMLTPTDGSGRCVYTFPAGDAGSGAQPRANHKYNTANAGRQEEYAGSGTISLYDWHVYTVEWTPSRVNYLIDNTQIGTTTAGLYSSPMNWILRCETIDSSLRPSASTVTRVEVDWLAMWSRA